MKRLIIKSSLFLLLILITCIAIEIAIQRMPNDYKEKNEYLDNKSDSIEILILGASDGQQGLNPEYLKGSYNASNPAQSLDYSYEFLKKYKDNWSKLKCIVLPLNYVNIFYKLEEDPKGAWRIKNFYLYYNIDLSKNPRYRTEILNGRLFEHMLRLIDYYVKKIDPITNSELGWWISTSYMTPDSLRESGIDAVKRHTYPKDEKVIREMKAALDSIVAFSEERGLDLILFTTPLYKSYRENVDTHQYNTTFKIYEELAAVHDHCTHLNFIDDERFKVEDYYDGDHLNDKGAKKLTLLLDSILQSEN